MLLATRTINRLSARLVLAAAGVVTILAPTHADAAVGFARDGLPANEYIHASWDHDTRSPDGEAP